LRSQDWYRELRLVSDKYSYVSTLYFPDTLLMKKSKILLIANNPVYSPADPAFGYSENASNLVILIRSLVNLSIIALYPNA